MISYAEYFGRGSSLAKLLNAVKLDQKTRANHFEFSPEEEAAAQNLLIFSRNQYSEPHNKPIHSQKRNKNDQNVFSLPQKKLRNWTTFEWFYSDIDMGWYLQDEFKDCLMELGYGNLERLTSIEWKYIRFLLYKNMGKPRRFSPLFIAQQREKLSNHRKSTRLIRNSYQVYAHYSLPPKTKVLAIHPRKRYPCRGVIVNRVNDSQYLVLFEGEKKEVSVIDTQIMTKQSDMHRCNHHLPGTVFSNITRENHKNIIGNEEEPTFNSIQNNKKVDESYIYGIYTRSDLENYCRLTSLLNQKEELQRHLTKLNDEVEEIKQSNESVKMDFRKFYAWIVLTLNETNKKIEIGLQSLTDRHRSIVQTYPHLNNTTEPNRNEGRGSMWLDSVLQGNSKDDKTTAPSLPSNIHNIKTLEILSNCINVGISLTEIAERKLDHAKANLILDAALYRLRPSHSANLGLYQEIASNARALKQVILGS
eukprot:TRINITY_DN4319_c0_g1_i2.p1 TRINITY_DN4319_c0_g1~~TRINITY_DN4319_c0_g1_i2.p1  ORF type:complete len:476 (+),score=73.42 TRINITY_DN4319_c0_g1_i2:70-1497(+)